MTIDFATGVLGLEAADITLFGSVPLRMIRTYSTRDVSHVGVFGPGWRWAFEARVKQTLEGYACTLASGSVVQFQQPPGQTSSRLFNPDSRLELRPEGDARVVLIEYGEDRNDNEAIFDRVDGRHYRLKSVRNRSNLRVELYYDESGRLTLAEQQRESREVRFSYDQRGLLSAAMVTRGATSLGVYLRYQYDELGRPRGCRRSRRGQGSIRL